MKDSKLVWSDEQGDLRKKNSQSAETVVDESKIVLHIRRLTSGKGRVVLELSNLPDNKNWCKKLAKDLKKSLGVGGAYKESYIEVHCDQLDKLTKVLETKLLKWKKVGG